MKTSLSKMIIALGLAGMATSAFAMSELASITVTPLWPTNSNPGNTVRYEVQVERIGQGLLEVSFDTGCLPGGCRSTFTDVTARFVGRDPRFQYFELAITGDKPTPLDGSAFTICGSAARESITITNIPTAAITLGTPASTLVGITALPGGEMEVRGFGDTGQSYQIEATASLTNPTWGLVGSCTADGNGRFTFIHAGAQTLKPSACFYRAVKTTPAN